MPHRKTGKWPSHHQHRERSHSLAVLELAWVFWGNTACSEVTDQHSDNNPLSPRQGCSWLEAMGKLEPVTHNFQPRAALSVYPYVPYKFCYFLSEPRQGSTWEALREWTVRDMKFSLLIIDSVILNALDGIPEFHTPLGVSQVTQQ